MTIDRDALVTAGVAAAIDKPSATTPSMIQFGSTDPDDVEDLRAVIANALDAILPEVKAAAYKLGWNDARSEGCSDEFAAGLWDEGLDAALPFSEIRADSFVRNQLHARNPYRKAASE